MKLALSLFFLAAALSVRADDSDIVDGNALTGWNKQLPSKWYSGFLKASQTKRLHYILVEAEAPTDPAKAPLVLWLNGGPGCSSMEGLFYEHGPLIVSDAHAPPNINHASDPSPNAATRNLLRNEWSWSKVASVLYMEAPCGVGFSYSTTNDPHDLTNGDNGTAADNLAALQDFFARFPRFQKNPFYVSGESYGGVYVPTLSQKIYEAKTRGEFAGSMTGYLVGNGVFDWDVAAAAQVPFAYGHGMIGDELHENILKVCDPSFRNPSAECSNLLKEVSNNFVDTNGYDVYRTCFHPPGKIGASPAAVAHDPAHAIAMFNRLADGNNKTELFDWLRGRTVARVGERSARSPAVDAGVVSRLRGRRGTAAEVTVPCINSLKGTHFLNEASVRAALHVDVSPNSWGICGGVRYVDDGVYPSIVAVHKDMLAKYAPRVAVYNGDVDPSCNYLWSERSVRSFGLRSVAGRVWRPWTHPNTLVGEQLGGFVTEYHAAGATAEAASAPVVFATIHGAGHMSPQWRPEAVYWMFARFMAQEQL
eukprot:TRINITY_DN2456_c0_g1_i1.p1 TRINITY_DN2456_c0_g1~~TRINITY_DN2456_c0_g1_i1.p1  ORF type:complete len:535 (+),score=124.61 TRINITY_DN2456_c0_g1_i1:233-1837(+)